MSDLTHLDEKGRARMVDVGAKDVTARLAVARGRIETSAGTLRRIMDGDLPKGDVLAVARTAAIMAAKQTPSLIPLCHPLPLDSVEVEFEPVGDTTLEVRATVRVTARTGAEMEALTAVAVGALTVYDMVKAIDRGVSIHAVELVEKSGGKSGDWRRD